MCVGALVHARIKHVVFGTTEPKAGSLVSARQLLEMVITTINLLLSMDVYMKMCSTVKSF